MNALHAPQTAVVILNWNGKHWLEKFLLLVKRHTAHEAEIVVADNASTDDSVAYLRANHPDVRLILLAENYGFAEGYNQALAQIDSEYVVLLNSDVETSDGWLSPLVRFLDENTEVAVVQPKIRSFHQPDQFEYAGAAGGFIDSYGYPFCRGRIFGDVEVDNGQYNNQLSVFWASGACFVVRLSVFRQAGGFDGSFFAHMEEIDLCWRIRALGYDVMCLPSSVVYHVGGGTLSQESPRKTFLNFRNNLLMLYKNLPSHRLRGVLLTRLFLDYLSAVQFLLKGKPKNALAVVKARWAFRQMKKAYVRHEGSEICPQPFSGLLLIPYFMRGKKRFSDIVAIRN